MSLSTALLASLLTGAPLALGAPLEPDQLEDVDLDADALAVGLDARVRHLKLGRSAVLAEESLSVLAPLADRAGLGHHRAALEDASMQVLRPDVWLGLQSSLDEVADRALLDRVHRELVALTDAAELSSTVSSRVKSRYGLLRKAERCGVEPGELEDRLGARVLVDDVAACYALLERVTSTWEVVPGSLDDYIASPKPSGYQSLHVAVRPYGAHALVEVQIRTHAMHHEAEHGVAAHWRYKVGQLA